MLIAGTDWHEISDPAHPFLIQTTSDAFVASIIDYDADLNGNGEVDAADYVLWRDQRYDVVADKCSGGDADCDGFVNDTDYSIWKSHFGKFNGTSTSLPSNTDSLLNVPEPASIVLLACGWFFLSWRKPYERWAS